MRRKLFIGKWFLLTVLAFIFGLYLIMALVPFSSLEEFIRQDSSVEIVDNSGARLHVSPLEEGMRRQ
jgi:hypothetical protein